jgi:hypothetical protein
MAPLIIPHPLMRWRRFSLQWIMKSFCGLTDIKRRQSFVTADECSMPAS